MKLVVQFAAALLAAAPSAAQQQLPKTATESGPAVSQSTAATLARTVAPADLMIPMEVEQARKAVLALPTVDEDAKQLEQEYPGLYAAVWVAAEPEMRRSTEAEFPQFWAALEQLYLSRLTEREAQAVLAFFRSPTGQKLLRNMLGSFDVTPLIGDMAKSKFKIDEQQMRSITDAAKAKAVQQIGPEDEASLLQLMASIDLEKFRAIGAETQKITLEWVNKEDPEGGEKLTKIMQAAMEEYMAAHPPKK